MRRTACKLALLLLAAWPLGAAEAPKGARAVTKPSADVTLSFPQPGRVAKILVREGQSVRAGDLLVQQDNAAEVWDLRQLEEQARNELNILAATAKLHQAQVDANMMEEAGRGGAAPAMEIEHAKLDVKIAELTLELARFQHEQDALKRDAAKARVERMRVASPIDGRVEKLFVHEGEGREAQQPVIRIVRIDPLWIDVPVPLRRARLLAVGEAARIEFPQDSGARAEGKVVHVPDVAEAGSEELLVRVEAPNAALRKAGEYVFVSLEAPGAMSRPARPLAPSPAGGEATPQPGPGRDESRPQTPTTQPKESQ